MESIELATSHHLQLRGDFVPAATGAAAVIFAHGLGSTRRGEKATAFATECVQRGWAFAAFDFHGHGDSDGTMRDLRGTRLLADLDAITQFVMARGHHTIFLVGSSMGGWAAAWFAALHPARIRACALIAPALRFLEWSRLTEDARAQWRQRGFLPVTNQWIQVELDYALHAEAAQYPFTELAARLQTPSLLLHGMLDDTVPYTTSCEFVEQCAAMDLQLLLCKHGDHRLSAEKQFIARVACDFLATRGEADNRL